MEFSLRGEYIELCSLLKAANLVMSGGEGKEVVAQGLVTVDGQRELRKRCKIRPGQTVEFQGSKIEVVASPV
jgi:ribosome-associated protein